MTHKPPALIIDALRRARMAGNALAEERNPETLREWSRARDGIKAALDACVSGYWPHAPGKPTCPICRGAGFTSSNVDRLGVTHPKGEVFMHICACT